MLSLLPFCVAVYLLCTCYTSFQLSLLFISKDMTNPTNERENRSEVRELRAEMKSLTDSVKFMSHEFDDMKKCLREATKEREALRRANEELRAKCRDNDNIIQQLQKRVVQSEQYSRRSNIEIKGLIKQENECVEGLAGKIGDVLGEPITPSDIEVCHRVPTRKAGKSNIIVQFRNVQKRDTVLAKARKARVRNNQVGILDDARVFVNEHLCPALKRLLSLALARRREYQWRFVWTRNGKVLARKTEASSVINIASEADLRCTVYENFKLSSAF